MAHYNCIECGTEMELLWEENKVICPKCGCWDEISDEEIEDFEGPGGLDVYEAALIWASHGKDEDYMFGYSEGELEAAL